MLHIIIVFIYVCALLAVFTEENDRNSRSAPGKKRKDVVEKKEEESIPPLDLSSLGGAKQNQNKSRKRNGEWVEIKRRVVPFLITSLFVIIQCVILY